MVHRTLLTLAILLGLSFPALAQQEGPIVIFLSENEEEYKETSSAFRTEMGKEVPFHTFSLADLDLRGSRTEVLLEKARKLNPQLFFAVGQKAFFLLKDVKSAPVIYAGIPDYLSEVISEKHKENAYRNVNGVFWGDRNCALETLSAFRELLPKARRVGIIYSHYSRDLIRELEKKAEKLGLEVYARKISAKDEAAPAIGELVKKVDSFLVLKRDKFGSRGDVRKRLLEIATAQNNIPVISTHAVDLKRGALATLDLDGARSGREAAKVAKDLQKAGGQNDPVIRDAKNLAFERKFNARIARELRVSFPKSTKWEMVE
jgi:ABC-type uncharacterized transport system substrate-binding protein